MLAKEAQRALEAGKTCFSWKSQWLHKPEQAKELVQVAQKQGLTLTVGFLSVFLPGSTKHQTSD
jgi:predicted dehydrogenase